MTYTQLTQEERYHIYGLLKAEFSLSAIARKLNRSPSTISRELNRNVGKRGYRPKQAQSKARKRKAINSKQVANERWREIDSKLRRDWSPEQIAHFTGVSHERIYQYIYADKAEGGDAWKHLRRQHKKRKNRLLVRDRRGQISNRVSIDERPQSVENRRHLGHWEVDTIIGAHHKQAIVSLVERKSRLTLIKKVLRKDMHSVGQAIIDLLMPYRDKVRSITADNGKEFADHEKIAKALNTKFYFAHPYSSWERGTNENTNGLIRQYFPKKYSFEQIDSSDIEYVHYRLNNRPRKVLGFKTPNEVFFHERKKLSVALRT